MAKEELLRNGHNKPVTLKDGEECATMTRTVGTSGVPTASENMVGEPRCAEDVRVGDVVLKLGKRVEQAGRQDAKTQGNGSQPIVAEAGTKEQDCRTLVRNYRTLDDDVKWAQNGLVATVVNGEAVPVVQSRITDAGFNDVILIPMGADKVFVRSATGDDVLAIVNNAVEFFQLLFSNWMRWDNNAQPYKRGAWVRLYGIPLQAWNVNFFKLCVFDCGR
ncbi:sulfate transporter, partial [Trifolium medium]|nr:sulfate transporter [Trifolium medium]